MVIKLCQNLNRNKRRIIYDNGHCFINFGFLARPQFCDFFQHISKKTQFSIKSYTLKMMLQMKSDDNFYRHCQLKIQNTELVFQIFEWNMANQNPFFRMLKQQIFSFLALFDFSRTPYQESKRARKQICHKISGTDQFYKKCFKAKSKSLKGNIWKKFKNRHKFFFEKPRKNANF